MSLTRIVLILTAMLLSGCARFTESYPGVDPDRLWNTMIAVSESPVYNEWHIDENEVWVDSDNARIEVYRVIKRDVKVWLGGVQRQEREMKHQLLLHAEGTEDQPGEPVVEFVDRTTFGIRAYAWDESARLFDALWAELGGRPAPMPDQAMDDAEADMQSEPMAPDDVEQPAPSEPDTGSDDEPVDMLDPDDFE